MPKPKLSKLELQILEALWSHGKASIREIQEAFPEPRPAYTTIQTTVYRLEGKKALRRRLEGWLQEQDLTAPGSKQRPRGRPGRRPQPPQPPRGSRRGPPPRHKGRRGGGR